VFLTEPRQPRAISAALLAEMTSGLATDTRTVADPREALDLAIGVAAAHSAVEPAVFATGSLFLVGDLRAYWHTRGTKK
jgi:folylpolyglutamate synthase/dihydropteroate synthase